MQIVLLLSFVAYRVKTNLFIYLSIVLINYYYYLVAVEVAKIINLLLLYPLL